MHKSAKTKKEETMKRWFANVANENGEIIATFKGDDKDMTLFKLEDKYPEEFGRMIIDEKTYFVTLVITYPFTVLSAKLD